MTDEATKDLMTSLITACLENEVQSDTSDRSSNSDFVLSRAATIVWMIEGEEQELELRLLNIFVNKKQKFIL